MQASCLPYRARLASELKLLTEAGRIRYCNRDGRVTSYEKKVKTYTISAVAELYEIHPQTLRLYEREGLLKPSRSEGNTRLYTDIDLERLEVILSLTRELGVNLAGVEIILNMRAKMDAMQQEFERFFEYLRTHATDFSQKVETFSDSEALIPISRLNISVRKIKDDESE